VAPRAGADGAAQTVLGGQFDLIIASDILYERDERGTLADFIARLSSDRAEIWIVDPNRGNRAPFNRHMARHGFAVDEQHLDHRARPGVDAYRGRMLTYRRA
jgi:predicted nicotinamide N-methyase